MSKDDPLDILEMSQWGHFDFLGEDFLEFDEIRAITAASLSYPLISTPPLDTPVAPCNSRSTIDNPSIVMNTECAAMESNPISVTQIPPIFPPTSATERAPTFIPMSELEKNQFVESMKNKNTLRKTESSIRQFQRWLSDPPRNEIRQIWTITPTELDTHIGSFLLSIRKADGSEYEPDTLTSYHRGLDRYLRKNKYPYSLVRDREFETSRSVLGAKRKELKQKGKGNRTNTAEPLEQSEKDILLQKGLLGTGDPEKLLNTLWLNNTVLFGIRGGTENRNLRWGDLQLKKTDSGREYIEFNERITKTRTAEIKTETRAFPPKQFPHEDTGSCPVYAYKEYAWHRPLNILLPNRHFIWQLIARGDQAPNAGLNPNLCGNTT